MQLYTPVNEMFICAQFSARYGWWNEQLRATAAFVTALKHIVKANVLAMRAILEVRPGRDLHPERVVGVFPRREPGGDRAGRGHERASGSSRSTSTTAGASTREMYEYLMDNGMTRDEYHFFLGNR